MERLGRSAAPEAPRVRSSCMKDRKGTLESKGSRKIINHLTTGLWLYLDGGGDDDEEEVSQTFSGSVCV